MLHTRKNNTRIPTSTETTNTSMRTGTHRTSPHQDQTPPPHISPDRNTEPATTANMHTDTGTATSAPTTSHSTGNQPRKPIRRKQPKPRHNHPISHVFAHVNSFCFRNDNQPAQKHGKNQTSHFHTLRHPNSNNKQKRLKSPKPRGKATTKTSQQNKNPTTSRQQPAEKTTKPMKTTMNTNTETSTERQASRKTRPEETHDKHAEKKTQTTPQGAHKAKPVCNDRKPSGCRKPQKAETETHNMKHETNSMKPIQPQPRTADNNNR